MMAKAEVRNILSKVGVVITDSHIVYKSGMHGSAYINTDVGHGREFLARKQKQ